MFNSAAGETSDDLSQPLSVMNTLIVLSGEATDPPFEKPNGLRIKVRFLHAAEKAAWIELDSELSQVLGKELQNKSFKSKLDYFGDSVYSHCLCQFGGRVRKEVTSSKNTRRQRQIVVLRAWKNPAGERFKAAVDIEK